MCNDYRRTPPMETIREQWSQTRIPLLFPEGVPNLAPLESIRITDVGTIIRASQAQPGSTEPAPHESTSFMGSAELVNRRWSWPGPGGKPVYNYRSDGREFGRGRCLIVADGFYEFTTPHVEPGAPKPKRKDKWLFTRPGEEWFCIAGLWRSTSDVGEAYTMLTAEPGPDVAPYHSRQVVVLDRRDWRSWLDPAVPASEVLRPLPAGSLEVTQVR
jgi:putative SOS response-associated peptidase YedK